MKKYLLLCVSLVIVSISAYNQTIVPYLGPEGNIIKDTLRSLGVEGLLGWKNDSTIESRMLPDRIVGRFSTGTGQMEHLTPGNGVVINSTTGFLNIISTPAVIDDANYTVAAGVKRVIYTRLTTGRTVTLPTSATERYIGREITIRNGGNGAFSLTLSVAVRSNLATTTTTVATATTITIVWDGAEWIIIN